MSDPITMTDEEALLWRKYVIALVEDFISKRNVYVLALLLSEIYEYCAAICENGTGLPVKLRSIKDRYPDPVMQAYLHKLYNVRNRSIHKPYLLNHTVVVDMIKDTHFETILMDFFPDEKWQFEDLITLMKIK